MTISMKQQREIKRFNAACPVGTLVTVRLDDGSDAEDEIAHLASLMGGHTPVAWLKERGSYVLSRVRKSVLPAASSVLNEVRAILKTPEGRSVVEWATEVMIRQANAEVEKRELMGACKGALAHCLELEDAWRSGALSESDGQGGTRSNRNVDVRAAMEKVIARAEGKTQ